MSTKRLAYGLYAVVAYAIGMASLVYLMGFVIGAPLPKTVDAGLSAPLPATLIANVAILVAFLVPHSMMARPSFKRWWTQRIPPELERATYILVSGVTLLAMMWAWQPMPQTIWHVEDAAGRYVLYAIYAVGWCVIVLATFNIDHFAFFGLRQVWDSIRSRAPRSTPFTARFLYGLVRHPISVGWLFVFWTTPSMTAGHLLLAAGMSLYIFIVTPIEEADLLAELGDDYARYRMRVRAFLPWPRGANEGAPVAERESQS